MRYNPAFLTDDELINRFVVRTGDLNILLSHLRRTDELARPHALLIGQRGSGKTTLLRRLGLEVLRDPELAQQYEAVVLHEELFEVASVDDLGREIRFHRAAAVAHRTNSTIGSALEAIKAEFLSRQKRLIVGIENFYTLLAEQFDTTERDRFLSLLTAESSWLIVVATTTARRDEITSALGASAGLFEVHELDRLDTSACRTLISSITARPIDAKKVRPIEILTGGNPRLVCVMSTFATSRSFRELMQQLTHLIDEHTSYFKSNLESLPFHERRVFVALADLWTPATTGDVGRKVALDVNRTSVYLNRLMARGLVQIAPSADRVRRYEVAERLYNIYYLMRRSGRSAARVRALVDFMLAFYTPEETMASVSHEACDVPAAERAPYFEIAETLLGHVRDSAEMVSVLDAIDPAFIDLAPASFRRKHLAALFSSSDRRQSWPDVTETALRTRLRRRPKDVESLLELASRLLETEGTHDDAIGLLERALKVEPQNVDAAFLLATARYQRGELDVAHKLLKHVTTATPAYVAGWLLLAATADVAGRLDEAAEAYDRVTQLVPSDYAALVSAGVFYHERYKDRPKAIRLLRKAIELQARSAEPYLVLADAYAETGNLDDAQQVLEAACRRFPDDVEVRHSLAHVLFDRRKYQEALEQFESTLANPTGHLLFCTGLTCMRLRHFEDAERYFRRAADLTPNDAAVWAALGDVLQRQEKLDDAEKVLKHSLSLKPEQAHANHLLGHVYEQLDAPTEAEAAFRRATNIDPLDGGAWIHLGLALERLERAADAREVFRLGALASTDPDGELFARYIERSLTDGADVGNIASETTSYLKVKGKTWQVLDAVARAMLIGKSEDALGIASRWAREAAVVAGQQPEPYLTLCEILIKQHQWREAIRLLPMFLPDRIARDQHKRLLEMVVTLAANSDIEELRDVLAAADRDEKLVPLRAALDLLRGETPAVPKEVLQVAADVRDQIVSQRTLKIPVFA